MILLVLLYVQDNALSCIHSQIYSLFLNITTFIVFINYLLYVIIMSLIFSDKRNPIPVGQFPEREESGSQYIPGTLYSKIGTLN